MAYSMIVSGNPNYGVAQALAAKFPTAQFCSRSHGGFDFARSENVSRFVEESLKHQVYVSVSCLHQFKQILLLEAVIKRWRETQHQGHIIAFGSTADTPVKGTPWIYPIEKKALKAFCRNLSFATLGGHGSEPSGIRITYISPGYVDTPGANRNHPQMKKLGCDYLAGVVAWVLDQPPGVNINEISLDPIQSLS